MRNVRDMAMRAVALLYEDDELTADLADLASLAREPSDGNQSGETDRELCRYCLKSIPKAAVIDSMYCSFECGCHGEKILKERLGKRLVSATQELANKTGEEPGAELARFLAMHGAQS